MTVNVDCPSSLHPPMALGCCASCSLFKVRYVSACNQSICIASVQFQQRRQRNIASETAEVGSVASGQSSRPSSCTCQTSASKSCCLAKPLLQQNPATASSLCGYGESDQLDCQEHTVSCDVSDQLLGR